MRLRSIWEGKLDGPLLGLYRQGHLSQYKRELGDVMPPAKRKHSLRVGGTLAGLGLDRDVVDAGLFHDYIERGGDIQRAATALGFSPRTVRLINLMSDENKSEAGDPLEHMRQVLADPGLDGDTRNHLVLVKLADRIDNLRRRLDEGNLSTRYLAKSRDLVRWLLAHYSGPPEYAQTLRGRLKELGVKIKQKHLTPGPAATGARPPGARTGSAAESGPPTRPPQAPPRRS